VLWFSAAAAFSRLRRRRSRFEHREFPRHWPRIGGVDFGWDHPFAAVELVWDRDTDTVYVSRTYCLREATAVIHAAALKPWGNLPWAWPRDGRRETLEGAGKPLADQYRAQGLDMLHEHSQFEDGSVSVEAGIQDMLIRTGASRFSNTLPIGLTNTGFTMARMAGCTRRVTTL